MHIPKYIVEKKSILVYLKKRNLLKQYKKAKDYILENNLQSVKFKERIPKGSGIFYFRINKQFRALGVFQTNDKFVKCSKNLFFYFFAKKECFITLFILICFFEFQTLNLQIPEIYLKQEVVHAY